jgi:hypothetical protein
VVAAGKAPATAESLATIPLVESGSGRLKSAPRTGHPAGLGGGQGDGVVKLVPYR